MTADWNWFFSTLSQSTAAIVGIIGAFIIAKIFANQAVFNEKNNRLKTLLVEAEKILDKINTINFQWYNERTNSPAFETASSEIRNIAGEDPTTITDDVLLHIIDESDFSIFSEKEALLSKLREEVIFVCKGNQEKRLREEAAERARQDAASGNLTGIGRFTSLLGNISDFSFSAPRTVLNVPDLSTPWAALRQERDLITECHLEAKHHARIVGDFLESVKGNPESPPQITWSLVLVAFIFMAGVIYPLTFMPATSAPEFTTASILSNYANVKAVLLTILAIAFIYVFGMFTRTNIKMKYAGDQVNKLSRLAKSEEYCKYFKYLPKSADE